MGNPGKTVGSMATWFRELLIRSPRSRLRIRNLEPTCRGAGAQLRSHSKPCDGLDSPGLHCLAEQSVVALVLVCVGLRERGHRAIEGVALAQVGSDGDAVAGAGVGARESPGTEPSPGLYRGNRLAADVNRPLPVAELAHIVVVLLPIQPPHPLPAKEDVAGRLHQSLAGHDALTVVAVLARTREPLEDGLFRLLRLQEQGIGAIPAEKQQDPRAGPDTTDSDYLPRQLDEAISLE